MPVPAQDGVVTPGTMPDDIIAYLYNLEKRHLVWDALRPWFEAQGYILYPNRYPGKLSEVFKYDLSEEHTDVPSVHVGDKSLRARMRSMIFIPVCATFIRSILRISDMIISSLHYFLR